MFQARAPERPHPVISLIAVGFLGASGCASTQPKQPPGVPPTPTTVTQAEPGGDAYNPELEALHRLLKEPWGAREDKEQTVYFPLPDWQIWRPVRYYPVAPDTGFRYGDEHHGVAGMFLRHSSKDATSDDCMKDFEQWAEGLMKAFGAMATDAKVTGILWKGKPIVIHSREAGMEWGMSQKKFATTYAAFPAWPGTCAIVGYGFPESEDAQLAKSVRDRFEKEAFPYFTIRNPQAPRY